MMALKPARMRMLACIAGVNPLRDQIALIDSGGGCVGSADQGVAQLLVEETSLDQACGIQVVLVEDIVVMGARRLEIGIAKSDRGRIGGIVLRDIGEMGFSRSEFQERQTSLTQDVTEAAIAWGVPYIVQWSLYDQSAVNDFGLYDLNGNITELGIYYKRMFARPMPGGRPPYR